MKTEKRKRGKGERRDGEDEETGAKKKGEKEDRRGSRRRRKRREKSDQKEQQSQEGNEDGNKKQTENAKPYNDTTAQNLEEKQQDPSDEHDWVEQLTEQRRAKYNSTPNPEKRRIQKKKKRRSTRNENEETTMYQSRAEN